MRFVDFSDGVCAVVCVLVAEACVVIVNRVTDRLYGQPGNVRDFTRSQGSVPGKKSCQGKVA